jgi:hypothetical protein
VYPDISLMRHISADINLLSSVLIMVSASLACDNVGKNWYNLCLLGSNFRGKGKVIPVL